MNAARMTAARLLRLCLKELRESLRDRRTIVTLLLMPLMVYPLLSLVLNRVVPTTDAPILVESTVRIGISNNLRNSGFEAIVLMGYVLLQDPETTPVFIDLPKGAQENGQQTKGNKAISLPFPHFVQLTENDSQALRRNSIDVAIIGKLELPDNDVSPTESPALEKVLKQLSSLGNLPPQFAIDSKQLSQALGRYEIAYRFGDPQSERAFTVVERSLMALNSLAHSKRAGVENGTPFTISGSPITIRHGHAELLATIIPLVLVLMTMAGAVYPAIDLTAGERERGTMEALVVSPTSSVWILFSKYSAVVIVALLTALANLGAMSFTLWVSGVGRLIFGESTLTAATIGQVLILLILFTMFFAALLLAVTSFAKSFKEAQAYLIPLMLLALTPGVTSLMPGIQFTPLLATVPLVNIVLLARELLQGDVSWNAAVVTLVCNCIYAMAALTIAARLFGASAAIQGSQGTWQDWFTRPIRSRDFATVDQMALLMAVLFPLFFVMTSIIAKGISSMQMQSFLLYEAVALWCVAAVIPFCLVWFQRIRWSSSFYLSLGNWRKWSIGCVAIILLAVGCWVVQHELTVVAIWTGIAVRSQERILSQALYEAQFGTIPVWIIVFCNVITPAFAFEFLFRGFVLSSLHRASMVTAIVTSALLFGLFDMLAGHMLSLERFLPMFAMGLVLGWLALKSQSIWPGVLVRLAMLGSLQLLEYSKSSLPWQMISTVKSPLPRSWLIIGAALLVLGLFLANKACQQSGKPDAR
jgi:sodium transport system permease protein